MTAPDFTPAELATLRRFDQTIADINGYDLKQDPPLSPSTCDECLGDGVVKAHPFSARHTRECTWCGGSGHIPEKDCAS